MSEPLDAKRMETYERWARESRGRTILVEPDDLLALLDAERARQADPVGLREALDKSARRLHRATNAPGTFEDCDSQWCTEAKAALAAALHATEERE